MSSLVRRMFAPAARGRALLCGVLTAALLATTCGAAIAQRSAPIGRWHVEIKPAGADERVLQLSFDSKVLARRVTNTVFLPTSYRQRGPRFPAVYALHGTVSPGADNCDFKPLTSAEPFVDMVGCGGGAIQTDLLSVATQLDAMRFVVVAPDTDPTNSFCHTCMWVDGREDAVPNLFPLTARTVPADTFLNDELMQVVESSFNVRTDRAGRGVIGFSMGGWGALLQAEIHPDRYSYVGSISGVYETREPMAQGVIQSLGFLRDQGYGEPQTEPVWWEQFSPAGTVENLKSPRTTLFLSGGTTCLRPEDVAAPDCSGKWAPTAAPAAVWAEILISRQFTIAVRDLAAKRIPYSSVVLPGVHGSNNHRVFADYIVPSANQHFGARSSPAPSTFTYRSALTAFDVWGYAVHVSRAQDAFLSLVDAASTGRTYTVRGIGDVVVLSPPVFTPGRSYRVTQGGAGDRPHEQRLRAQDDGRLRIVSQLGDAERTVTVSVSR